MGKCGELWEFVRLSAYMHRTLVGYAIALAVVVTSFFGLGEIQTILSAVGIGWMGMLILVIMLAPFSDAITQRNWKPFKEEVDKLDKGEPLNPEKVDAIETTVEKKGVPFAATVTFVVMLFISDMKDDWRLRVINRCIMVGITLIGASALIFTGNVVFAGVWFVYHVVIDGVLFRAVEKARNVERMMAT